MYGCLFDLVIVATPFTIKQAVREPRLTILRLLPEALAVFSTPSHTTTVPEIPRTCHVIDTQAAIPGVP
jgi:hypothetical protein